MCAYVDTCDTYTRIYRENHAIFFVQPMRCRSPVRWIKSVENVARALLRLTQRRICGKQLFEEAAGISWSPMLPPAIHPPTQNKALRITPFNYALRGPLVGGVYGWGWYWTL